MKVLNIGIVIAVGACNLLAKPSTFEEQKINVYNVPYAETQNLDAKKLKELTEKNKPQYVVSQGVSSGKTLIRTNNDKVTIVMDKNRSPILNYNDILLLAESYAQKNIPLLDKNRIASQLSLAKIKTSQTDADYDKDKNEEFITAISENRTKKLSAKNYDGTVINFSALSLIDNINYFIENYSSINKTQNSNPNKDVRYQLVKNIKEKVVSHDHIDSGAIDYSITLKDLKMLKSLIVSN